MPLNKNTTNCTLDYQPGKLFKLLRNLREIKQDAAARKLGVKQQAVSKLENSKKISGKKFNEIIAAFNFTQEEIETAKKFLPSPG
jgi:transcriptional regulator with XRE-family HTH domain